MEKEDSVEIGDYDGLEMFLACLMALFGNNLSILVLEQIFFRESSLCFDFCPTEYLPFSPNDTCFRNNFSFVFHQRSFREAIFRLRSFSIPNAHFVSSLLLHWLSCLLPLNNAFLPGNTTFCRSTLSRNSSFG